MTKDLEIRHCRVLLAVHDTGGIGAAARVLGLAQSTVSETLLSLERLIGGAVTLRRPGREATLSPVAETLLPHARALVAASETAVAALARQGHDVIRLGAVESISSFLLPGPLGAFRRRWPQVDLRITIGLCEDLRRRVGRSELDAALTIEAAVTGREWSPARLALIVSPDHRFARRMAGPADLAAATFLLADPEGAFYDLLRVWLGGGGDPARLESAGSVDGVKRGVQASNAIGLLPDYAVGDELAAGALVALRLDRPLPDIALRLTTQQPLIESPLERLISLVHATLADAATV